MHCPRETSPSKAVASCWGRAIRGADAGDAFDERVPTITNSHGSEMNESVDYVGAVCRRHEGRLSSLIPMNLSSAQMVHVVMGHARSCRPEHCLK